MTVLYIPKEIQAALRELRIKPKNGKVTGREAATILSWRAKREQGIEHEYLDSAVRRHVERKNLKAYPVNKRFNMYKVEDVFEVPLVPGRGLKQKEDGASASMTEA